MQDLLDTIQARADAATAGPWKGFDGFKPPALREPEKLKYVRMESIDKAEGSIIGYIFCEHETSKQHLCDVSFIAHARQDIPRLIAALRVMSDSMKAINILSKSPAGFEITDKRHCLLQSYMALTKAESILKGEQ